MLIWMTLAAALLLSIERMVYVLIWRHPEGFAERCRRRPWTGLGEPVDVLQALFVVFKIIQIGVFVAWWSLLAESFPPWPTARGVALVGALTLIVAGQTLNFAVFWRLGKVGVFYGNKLGHQVAWVRGFPFSLVRHPQYVGTVISIWGAFLLMRYPHPDWLILPAMQTLYYLVAISLEQ